MPREKHVETAVLLYFGLLLIMVVGNLLNKISLFDIVYLVVVLCCVLKYFIIVRDNKK